jgi:hypothetical protein
MNDNELFSSYMYKKALLDIVAIDPELINTIDGSYFDEKDFHAFQKTQIIQHSHEEIIDNDRDILQESFFLVKGQISSYD